MLVAVGSTNPTKIDPVKMVFSHYFPGVKVIGCDVDSGIKEQPDSDNEMYQGAYNRAKASLIKVKGSEYGVGIEGGIHKYKYGWFERSLVVIINKQGKTGLGASGGLLLPDKVVKLIKQGKSLEQAIDEIFGTKKIGRGIGMFGIMTKGYVTRTTGVSHGVAFALARFLHQDIY